MEADEDGRPLAVYLSGRRYAVEAVLERWRIDDEWWRQRPVSRVYYSLLLEDGRPVTIYIDWASRNWWIQRYLSLGKMTRVPEVRFSLDHHSNRTVINPISGMGS